MPSTDGPSGLDRRHPLDVTIHEQMARPTYRDHKDLWERANDRLLDDPEGAITTARSLLERTCKQVLNELAVSYSDKSDLTKLYNDACKALGMAPGGQVDPSFRAVFSSTFQIVQSVAEIRNKYGDAHGKGDSALKASRAEAELVAVHLAGAVSCFLVSRFEAHLSATRRLTRDGKAVLWFDKSIVWRLVDHATNSPKTKPWYGEDVGPCLMLVGDAGVYLMSNGDPPIFHDGTLIREEGNDRKLLLVANAEGCDSSAEFEAWWPIHNAIDGGNDFSIPIPVEEVRAVLLNCHLALVIVADQEGYEKKPAFNEDRGPVSVLGGRLHAQF